jgi:hypothetical protein
MVFRAALLWGLGLVTAVPYATYYLFFEASRDQYAWLITLILFWVFGYWGVVGPLLSALQVRRVFALLEQAHAQAELAAALRSPETESMAIDLLAAENGLPRFIAAALYRRLVARIAARAT